MSENTTFIIIAILAVGIFLGLGYWGYRRNKAEERFLPPQGPVGNKISTVLSVIFAISILVDVAACASSRSSELRCISYGFTGLVIVVMLIYRWARQAGK